MATNNSGTVNIAVYAIIDKQSDKNILSFIVQDEYHLKKLAVGAYSLNILDTRLLDDLHEKNCVTISCGDYVICHNFNENSCGAIAGLNVILFNTKPTILKKGNCIFKIVYCNNSIIKFNNKNTIHAHRFETFNQNGDITRENNNNSNGHDKNNNNNDDDDDIIKNNIISNNIDINNNNNNIFKYASSSALPSTTVVSSAIITSTTDAAVAASINNGKIDENNNTNSGGGIVVNNEESRSSIHHKLFVSVFGKKGNENGNENDNTDDETIVNSESESENDECISDSDNDNNNNNNTATNHTDDNANKSRHVNQYNVDDNANDNGFDKRTCAIKHNADDDGGFVLSVKKQKFDDFK
ncbi:TELOKIN-like protein-20 [Trabala vishnou gigantina nucleopolyhedrovirus]|uniref:TELOKIN-like protein-20 n=1 Tax=Trabala vishnou gigantina nucleopolyhedrovirus TaxID=2863583 RepID=UPI002481E080|nr:TELOKIN-like protein-20 [Trabala vishnou gigantina nucleopolyhedrovirus]QYC92694.1 TELOKIN-like protein-20 [Trabala vishnou gigantina nucleopolyhedrovirus]